VKLTTLLQGISVLLDLPKRKTSKLFAVPACIQRSRRFTK
jgi:hypothetical protein